MNDPPLFDFSNALLLSTTEPEQIFIFFMKLFSVTFRK